MASPVILNAGPAPRGGGTQQVATYGDIQSVDLTWSWGARPASAVVVYVSDEGIEQNAAVTIVSQATNDALTGAPIAPGAAYSTFYGICKKEVATDSSAGRINTLEFVDMRELLSWDIVFGYYNKREDLLTNGIWTKRYAHLLPFNVGINLVTYTDSPYAASDILNFIFDAPTVHSPWVRLYQEVQYEDAVYNIDCSTGRTVADVVTEITQRQGLVFTLLGGPFQLVWVIKGFGYIPPTYDDFPANSDDRRLGEALSEKPDSVTICGARNRYQTLNIPMQADWNLTLISDASEVSNDYTTFELDFIDWVYFNCTDPITKLAYTNTPSDPEEYIGGQLAKARSETMTLGEFADIIDGFGDTPGGGEIYRDRRKFNGRTRLDMPVLIYVKLLVWRAFRLPDNFTLVTASGRGLSALSCKIVPTTLVETTYDYVTGAMDYIEETAPGGNGLAIVQGFNFQTPPPTTFRSDQFDLASWQNSQKLWQKVNFQIDDTGDQTQFIILDQAVFTSQNLMTTIDGHGVLSAQSTFSIPAVIASLCFEAERFLYYQGVEGVNAVENVADLNADFVADYAMSVTPAELPFADGETATFKAGVIADYILQQQPVYVYGGYTNRGNNATQLSGTIDRVHLYVDAERGLLESVDFTSERAANTFEPERDFERRIQLIQLAPGQLDLRNDARAIWSKVAALRHNPTILRMLLQEFHNRYGSGSLLTFPKVADVPDDRVPFNMGTPLWKAPSTNTGGKMSGTLPVLPEDADPTTTPVFAGVTVRDQEAADGYVPLQNDGWGLARVMGPANVGDSLGQAPQPDDASIPDYLTVGGTPAAGTCQQVIADANVYLVQVNLGQGSGGGGAQQKTIASVQDNYMTMTDGTFVALPFELRRTTYDGNSETLPDGLHTYAYIGLQRRRDTTVAPDTGTIDSVSVIYPPYAAGKKIDCLSATTGVTQGSPAKPVSLVDINNDSRKWKAQIVVCYNGVTAYLLTDCAYYGTIIPNT